MKKLFTSANYPTGSALFFFKLLSIRALSHSSRSPRWIYPIFLLLVLLSVTMAFGQTPPLTSCDQCVSNDIKVEGAYLADPAGNPLPNTCTPGATVAAQLCVRFSVTSQNRYGLYFGFDYTVGSTTSTQSQCYAQTYSQGPFTLCYPITYTCGQTVTITSILLAWGNQRSDLNTFCTPANLAACRNLTPKCYSTQVPLVVEAPLIANFTSTASCQTGQTVQTVAFTGVASGGTPAYSYAWDLDGNGTFETTGQNPTRTYTTPGNYNVTVRVTDSNGVTDVQSYSVSVMACALPVTYTYFRAQSVAEGTQVAWQTSLEVNHDHFEVQRSNNAVDFETISPPIYTPASVEANRNMYQYIDRDIAENTLYYRLKQVDLSGAVNYSKIVSVVSADGTSVMDVSPNPVVNQVDIRLRSGITGPVQIDIIDVTGKRWGISTGNKTALTYTQSINTQALPHGSYVISVRVGDRYFRKRIIK